jgi:two-component system OmpR family response regulator
MRILVVEDDERAAAYLIRGLRESGHVVDSVGDGATGLAMTQEGIYDALIVDRKLPVLDGLSLVRALREQGNATPVLMLSALASTEHRVEGLRLGCDDYLAKPYAFVEVLARLEALLRRSGQRGGSACLQVADLTLDFNARTVTRAGKSIVLQHREFLILEKLMRHANQVVTRAMLLESAWDYDFDPRDNLIDKHIHRLRQKMDEGFAIVLIHTVPGAGYMLSADPSADGSIP